MTNDDLAEFLGATRRHLDAELAASTARPDLAASVARAREIDPSAVSAAAVAEVAELPLIAQLRPRSAAVRENMSDKTALGPFTTALRHQLDADLARQIHRAAIAQPAATTTAQIAAATPTSPTAATVLPLAAARSRRPIIAVGLALAAALLLSLGLRGAFEAQARQGAIPGAAALASLRAAASQTERRDPPRSASERPVPEDISPVPQDASPVPEDTLLAPVPQAIPPADKTELEPRPRPRKPASPPAPAADPPAVDPPAEDPLAALDRDAQALWRSGDLRGAADKFAEIVRRAPGTRAAETAYGDLFALEHQLGGEPVALWRAYLRQFPRGRYADDASAGVCRREPADASARCWTDYLAAHPDGAHRREAEQAAP